MAGQTADRWPRKAWSQADYDNWTHDDRRTEAEKNAVNTAARFFQDWLDRLSRPPTSTIRKAKAKALADEHGAAYGPMSWYAENASTV